MADSDKVQAAMQAKLATLDPASPRYKVLAAARSFKASWVGLAEHLTAVKASAGFKTWGYASFAAYCQQELHVREETARKLTRSFAYLQEHAPTVLRQQPDSQAMAPALDVVDLLSQARARTRVSPEAWASLEAEALSESSAPVSRQHVMKRLREVDPENYPSVERTAVATGASAGPQDLRKILLLAERLESLLKEQPGIVSDACLTAAGRIAKELRQHGQSKAATGPAAASQAPRRGGSNDLCSADQMQ